MMNRWQKKGPSASARLFIPEATPKKTGNPQVARVAASNA